MARDAGGWIEELLVSGRDARRGSIAGSDVLHYSETLGRRIRSDATWAEAAVSTYSKAQERDPGRRLVPGRRVRRLLRR